MFLLLVLLDTRWTRLCNFVLILSPWTSVPRIFIYLFFIFFPSPPALRDYWRTARRTSSLSSSFPDWSLVLGIGLGDYSDFYFPTISENVDNEWSRCKQPIRTSLAQMINVNPEKSRGLFKPFQLTALKPSVCFLKENSTLKRIIQSLQDFAIAEMNAKASRICNNQRSLQFFYITAD